MANRGVNQEIFIQHYNDAKAEEDFLTPKSRKILSLVEVTPEKFLENLQNQYTLEDFVSSKTRFDDHIKSLNRFKKTKINPTAFLKFFKDGNTTEDILKSEAEIKELVAEIYENKDNDSKVSNTKLKAEEALNFINTLKGI